MKSEITAKEGAAEEIFTVKSAVFEKGTALSEDEEAAEIYAKAFNKISTEFFKKRAELKDEINKGRKEQKKGVLIGICVSAFGIFLIISGINWIIQIGIILIILGLIISTLLYRKWKIFMERKREEIEQLEPEKRIKFLSKVNLPVYIIPYDGGSMIFDARNLGEKEEIIIENIHADRLLKELDVLEQEVQRYKEIFSRYVKVEDVMNYDEHVYTEKKLEGKIISSLMNVKNVFDDVKKSRYTFTIHKPQSKIAQSTFNLWKMREKMLVKGSYNTVPSLLSLSEAISIIDGLRGIEVEVLRGDVIGIVKESIGRVNDVIVPILETLNSNLDVVNNCYEETGRIIDALSSKYFCEMCSRSEGRSEYKLKEFIEESMEYTRRSLEELGEEKGWKEVESILESLSEVGLELPDDLLDTLVSDRDVLKDPVSHNVKCEMHGENVKTLKVIFGGDIFARTAVAVFDELKVPILKRAEDMWKELNEAEANMRKERLAIAPFEQIYNQLEVEKRRVDVQIKSLDAQVERLRQELGVIR